MVEMDWALVSSSDIIAKRHSDKVPKHIRKELEIFVKERYPNKSVKLMLHIKPDGIEVFKAGGGIICQDDDDDTPEAYDPESYVLPALYGKDKKGKERMWKIWAIKNVVYKAYGESGGVMTPSTRSYKGVNMGKVNETTPEEQAKREAERDWVKQLDKEYYPKSKEGKVIAKRVLDAKRQQGGTNVNVAMLIRGDLPTNVSTKGKAKSASTSKKSKEPSSLSKRKPKGKNKPSKSENGTIPGYKADILPMHCQVWSEEAKTLKYFDFDKGVYIQPKLDGVRALVKIVEHLGTKKVVMLTRTGNQLVWLSHLRAETLAFLDGHEDVILDCEVYADHIFGVAHYDGKRYTYSPSKSVELENLQRFDVISGAARPVRGKPHPLEGELSLYVFDVADPTGKMDQDARFDVLKKLFSRNGIGKTSPHIKRVETKIITSIIEVKDYHDEVASKGYEGVVLRSRKLRYESHKKSLSMRKYKYFIDEEYPIVGVKCDDGVEREHFLWMCEKVVIGPKGRTTSVTFPVKPMGTRERKWEWYDNSDEYVGKLLTVRYQELTNEKVPRFPRGVSIRDY